MLPVAAAAAAAAATTAAAAHGTDASRATVRVAAAAMTVGTDTAEKPTIADSSKGGMAAGKTVTDGSAHSNVLSVFAAPAAAASGEKASTDMAVQDVEEKPAAEPTRYLTRFRLRDSRLPHPAGSSSAVSSSSGQDLLQHYSVLTRSRSSSKQLPPPPPTQQQQHQPQLSASKGQKIDKRGRGLPVEQPAEKRARTTSTDAAGHDSAGNSKSCFRKFVICSR